MKRLNDYYEFTLAGHWLPALINGDESGLTDDESADLDAFMRPYYALEDMTIDIVDDEPSFTTDDISGDLANCYAVRFYFTNKELDHAPT